MTHARSPVGRRLLAGVATASLLLTPTAAVAQDPTDPAAAAAEWLVGELVDGNHLEGEFGPQYGPTADVGLGLLTSGEQPDALADVLDFLTAPESVDAYVHGAPFDGQETDDPTYVGANAKLGFLVTTAGMDPRSIGGDDLVENMLSLENDETGAFEDRSDFGDYANVFGQSFAILFLTVAHDVEPSDASVDYLLAARCDDGGFPQDFGQDECESSADATGLALQALLAALPPGERAPLQDTVDWLTSTRDADGAWGGAAGDQNINSTGYAGMALLADGRDVTASVSFLREVQNEDGGLPVAPGDPSDAFATAQALPLLSQDAFLDLVPGVVASVDRIAGDTRLLTAIDVSRASFDDGAASTVVLTRDDLFADALAGTPLAVRADGPLLTTPQAGLDADVLAEIQRVLPEAGEVLVLGGPHALPASVDEDLAAAGFAPRRVAGDTRFHTSVEIAEELGDPDLQLLTTGLDFPDALTAGTAAAANGGAVLLTDGDAPHEAVAAYLDVHDGDQVAIGGPAAAAHPGARPLVGDTRDTTAVLVADEFFDDAATVGIARRDLFVDALAGGVLMARVGGPLVLTATTELPDATSDLLCGRGLQLRRATVFGGPVAVDDGVVASVRDRVAGTGC